MIKILAIGRKHEKWITAGIDEFEKRLKKPFDIKWDILPHSNFSDGKARDEESTRIEKKLPNGEFVILLDERGKNISSPEFANMLNDKFVSSKDITIIIGGAYGVNEDLRQRADFTWSLSKLVFPHQIVRLILTEQIYRAQEISSGGKYHHV